MQVFKEEQTRIYAAMTLRSGLLLYAKAKVQPNRLWTPGNMLKAATRYTGVSYKRGQYKQAAADLAIVIGLYNEGKSDE